MKQAIERIVKKHGSPVYIYSEKIMLKRIREILSVFRGLDFRPTFALKANSNPALLSVIRKSGFGMDVVSRGEMTAAIMAGTDPADIIWNGNGKTEDEMRDFLKAGIGRVNIDSMEELEAWAGVLAKNRKSRRPEFFVRINPDVDAGTHFYISTGLKKHKFGIRCELLESFLQTAKSLSIEIAGLHSHIGSQITEVAPYLEAFTQLVSIARENKFKKLNIGGGWGINYTGKELDLKEYRRKIIPLLHGFEITAEFGRYVVAEAGTYAVTVQLVKYNGFKYFVVVDGGMNHLIRPALYGAIHDIEIIGAVSKYVSDAFDIVGPLCETGDILYLNREDSLPKKGSIIAVKNAGAYGYSMASNYNATPRPAEVLLTRGGRARLIRERETVDDIFAKVIL